MPEDRPNNNPEDVPELKNENDDVHEGEDRLLVEPPDHNVGLEPFRYPDPVQEPVTLHRTGKIKALQQATLNARQQAALNECNHWLGTKEGPGSNEVIFNKVFYGRDERQPWCQAFAWYVQWNADLVIGQHCPAKTAYTPTAANWYKDRNLWGTTPRVGAQAFYNISGLNRISHTGVFVTEVLADGYFKVFEGNTNSEGSREGDGVWLKLRKGLGPGGGFGYPIYDGVSPPDPDPKPDADPDLVVDGVLGPKTYARLQDSLNDTGANPRLDEDGISGPLTKRALQARLNQTHPPVAVDGIIGPQTVRALQRNVGADVDGLWGPNTTRALQKTLNERDL